MNGKQMSLSGLGTGISLCKELHVKLGFVAN